MYDLEMTLDNTIKWSNRLFYKAITCVKLLKHKIKRSKIRHAGSDCQISNLDAIYKKFFGEGIAGTFVEIGANNGISVSNSIQLALQNWRGHLVEAVPDFAQLASANFQNFQNVTVHNTAIGEPGVTQISIHVAGLLSTARSELWEEFNQISWAKEAITQEVLIVPCITLDKFLSTQNVMPNFELLIVDVEGFESKIFMGFEITRWRPKMMIIELSDTHPELKKLQREHAELYLLIIASDYIVVYKDAINTVFVRNDLYFSKCLTN